MSKRRGLGRVHWCVVIDGIVYMFSNLSHAVPVLREMGVRVSASRLYNEHRDKVDRARGLLVPKRSVTLAPRVTIARVTLSVGRSMAHQIDLRNMP